MKMKRILVLFFLTGAVLLPRLASAQLIPDSWYVSPIVGHVFADSARNTDDGMFYGLALGRALPGDWTVEAEVTGDKLDFNGAPAKIKHTSFGINLIKVNREAGWHPYFLAGAGYLHHGGDVESGGNAYVNVGIGGMWQLTQPGIGLRVDLRYRVDFDNETDPGSDNFGDTILSAGINVPFGG